MASTVSLKTKFKLRLSSYFVYNLKQTKPFNPILYSPRFLFLCTACIYLNVRHLFVEMTGCFNIKTNHPSYVQNPFKVSGLILKYFAIIFIKLSHRINSLQHQFPLISISEPCLMDIFNSFFIIIKNNPKTSILHISQVLKYKSQIPFRTVSQVFQTVSWLHNKI